MLKQKCDSEKYELKGQLIESNTAEKALTPDEMDLLSRMKNQKKCQRCKGSMENSKAISFFTYELICGTCFKSECEVQYKLMKKTRNRNIRRFENIGYIPEV